MMTEAERQSRKHKKYLKQLTASVSKVIEAIDKEMKKPSSTERGKNIAALTNWLELQNDMAKRFGLK